MFCWSQGDKDEDGTWYRKSDTPKEVTGAQTGKKKKEAKKKGNAEQKAST